jgi:hypothetical protein
VARKAWDDYWHERHQAELEAIRVARERREMRAREWYQDDPKNRDKAKRLVLRYLRSGVGRDGATVDDLGNYLSENDHALTSEALDLVVESLVRVRSVRFTKDRDGVRLYWDAGEFARLNPERRWAVRHIDTVPQAVRRHPDVTGARLKVAVALSAHFYRTRRSWPKAKAVGYRELAKEAGVTPRTASESLEWLRA